MLCKTLAVVSTLAVGLRTAGGAITYLSQTRSLNAYGAVTHDSAAATNFGLFDRSISAIDFSYNAQGTASQTSSLGPTGIMAIGAVSAQDGLQTTAGFGSSLLDVSFAVDAPTDYTLVGSWTAMLYPGGYNTVEAVFRLTQSAPSSTLFSDTFSGSGGGSAPPILGSTINQSGTLSPGSYRLELSLSQYSQYSDSSIATQTGSFNIALNVPAPASAPLLLVGSAMLARRRRPVF